MKILLIGSGAREHAMAWKIGQSNICEKLWIHPGNTAWPEVKQGKWNLLEARGFEDLVVKSKQLGITLLVVGPDQALEQGIVDLFEKNGIQGFGPKQAAAKIEFSKSYSKELMLRAGVPTARFKSFEQVAQAIAFIEKESDFKGWVVKADGLALGKGVQVCREKKDAVKAVQELIKLSGQVLIEELLVGSEVSWLAICDGKKAALFDSARDYKRIFTGDHGPNTGGMGVYSPVPGFSDDWAKRLEDEVFTPVLREMDRRGTPFVGILYAGLMVDFDSGRFWVLEFNARFGDPEAQVLLPRMKDDLVEWMCAAVKGELPSSKIQMIPDPAVYVVAAADGYPGKPVLGDAISGLSDPLHETNNPSVFLAGVRESESGFETSGGRVLGTLGLGSNLLEARRRAYHSLSKIQFRGKQFRSDISGTPIAILASGRGSNFEAICDRIRMGQLHAQVLCLISDRENAKALETAKRFGIETFVVGGMIAKDRELRMIEILRRLGVSHVVLAGYMKILGHDFIEAFTNPDGSTRVINIHPSLLPAFPGLKSYQKAFESGLKETGITVHEVDETLDGGRIFAQAKFSIEDCQSASDVEAKGLKIEHELYSKTIANWLRGDHVHPN